MMMAAAGQYRRDLRGLGLCYITDSWGGVGNMTLIDEVLRGAR